MIKNGHHKTDKDETVFKSLRRVLNVKTTYPDGSVFHDQFCKRYVCELVIPKGTRYYGTTKGQKTPNDYAGFRQTYSHGKCRAERARVVKFTEVFRYNDDRKPTNIKTAYSSHDRKFKYKIGETVKPDHFGEARKQCAGGIHFFRTFKEAQDWS